jgi:cation diffusion facilitator CzcD-associated flavoprotein CzcO
VNEFDRIVLGDGLTSKAITPEFEGMKKFRGKIIHSQAYKRYVILHGYCGFS